MIKSTNDRVYINIYNLKYVGWKQSKEQVDYDIRINIWTSISLGMGIGSEIWYQATEDIKNEKLL